MDKIKIKNPFVLLLILPIKIYQYFISPLILNNCRFSPTCSNYCIKSLEKFGLIKGLFYSFLRITKCHPLGKTGYDPVKPKIIFKEISLEIIKKYRKENLYKNLPKKLATYKEDNYKNTKHFGLFCDDFFVSGLTIIEQTKSISEIDSLQIRGMFTVKNKYNMGYGSTLINLLLKYLRKKKTGVIWCNSRMSAINFYKKNNFKEVGQTFEIKLIGKHKKLVRYF